MCRRARSDRIAPRSCSRRRLAPANTSEHLPHAAPQDTVRRNRSRLRGYKQRTEPRRGARGVGAPRLGGAAVDKLRPDDRVTTILRYFSRSSGYDAIAAGDRRSGRNRSQQAEPRPLRPRHLATKGGGMTRSFRARCLNRAGAQTGKASTRPSRAAGAAHVSSDECGSTSSSATSTTPGEASASGPTTSEMQSSSRPRTHRRRCRRK